MGKGKVFGDPLHDLIVVDPADTFVVDLVDTPEMQRLRRIRQLGLSYLTYQGAEHSRFTHSLGVYHCVCRILGALQSNHSDDQAILDLLHTISRPVKAAGLLHDIGHGPFSHVFEKVAGDKSPHHEDWTAAVILSPDSAVSKVLESHNIEPQAVADIIRKTSQLPLATDIISSELDADRMDYLLRDSLMCGVTYGRFDLGWMLRILHAAEVSAPDGTTKVMKLCADAAKGLRTVEQYVLDRIQMYDQVYYHKTTRAMECLLTRVLEYASFLWHSMNWRPSDTPATISRFLAGDELNLSDYMELDDFSFTTALRTWASMACRNPDERDFAGLVSQLVHRGRPLRFVDVTEKGISVGKMMNELDHGASPLRFHYAVDNPESTAYKGVLYSLRKKAKTPEELLNSTIYLLDNGAPVPVETESVILKGLSGVRFQSTRLYYDRNLEKEFGEVFAKFDLI